MRYTNILKNSIGIIIGAALFSFGLTHFSIQNELGEGGFTGITLILYFALHWNPAILNLLLNIPMFLIGWRLLGKKSFMYTLLGTISCSIFIAFFQHYAVTIHLQDDLLLASLFAGVCIGIGLGIIFRCGGTTGGVDIIARLIHKYYGWSIGKTMFVFDVVVLLVSSFTFLDERSMMYTLVAIFVGTRVVDFIQNGAYAARGVFIISDNTCEIADAITSQMERGVTTLHGQGHFTKKARNMLYCVVARNEIVELKTIVQKIDPQAFFSIIDVYEVAGEGFTLDANKQPIH